MVRLLIENGAMIDAMDSVWKSMILAVIMVFQSLAQIHSLTRCIPFGVCSALFHTARDDPVFSLLWRHSLFHHWERFAKLYTPNWLFAKISQPQWWWIVWKWKWMGHCLLVIFILVSFVFGMKWKRRIIKMKLKQETIFSQPPSPLFPSRECSCNRFSSPSRTKSNGTNTH